MNQERLMKVLLGPVISEKATNAADKHRQVVFKVLKNATKPEIKDAVELMFKVKVDKVTVLNVKGKNKMFRFRPGKRSDWKKAYVSLAEGHDINFAGSAAE
jgi:large subunit ribosomal protein L23